MSTSRFTQEDLHARGEAVRRELVGEERFAKSGSGTYADPMMKEFLHVATTSVFGNIWARPGLDLKLRVLIVCISDIATGAFDELEIHLQMAIRQGWTREELMEAILQLLGYIGAPSTREAMKVCSEVWHRHEAGTPNLD
ncbi:MAG TPA: carboxymuconolactone decarboxylase family protein [Ramlibacter sp.]|uniref:carboxymuconolactone decarboxylase family protein n=1 Tax=Ramlibacter sp. TaxID=1917967 RepID=UPI002CA39E3F|nr:carboxymuconolactone decarboxylase family protein [Ramlibacter sp.]HVZ45243.1 carboxymuconolactone decarboxylase family protein [Ramlibacter sp.]